MEPISSGFQEGRQLSESMMDQVCQDYMAGGDSEQLEKVCSYFTKTSFGLFTDKNHTFENLKLYVVYASI